MFPRSSIESNAAAGFVAATFDGFTALFSQANIVAVEQKSHLTDCRGLRAVYRKGDIHALVFSLSRSLEPVAQLDRPFFIVARHKGGAFGLSCDELQVISSSRIKLRAIPDSLKCGKSPIESFAQFGKKIFFQCSLDAIADLLPPEETESHECEQSHPA